MHDERLWDLRQKRDREMHGIRRMGGAARRSPRRSRSTRSPISTNISKQFEANARSNGIHVHWARDAAEHNRIVHGILRDHGAKSLIKSKSMLTEECGFRHYMASVGIEVIETDLGERIQQLDNEDPSHVVVPAVHKLRTDVAEVFARTIGTDPGQQRRPLSGGGAARGDAAADPRRRRRHDRLQFRGRRDRHLRRLHQRGQRRSVGQRAEAAHRLDRHREDHPAPRASGGVRPPAVAQRAGLADHAVHLAFPRAAGRRRDARRAGRQRPLRAPRHGRSSGRRSNASAAAPA